jgi:hypothetical protein
MHAVLHLSMLLQSVESAAQEIFFRFWGVIQLGLSLAPRIGISSPYTVCTSTNGHRGTPPCTVRAALRRTAY